MTPTPTHDSTLAICELNRARQTLSSEHNQWWQWVRTRRESLHEAESKVQQLERQVRDLDAAIAVLRGRPS
jgi:polyhydroxyalkanoate synthesis regulator phasin